jgi:COP9 signalosome complex subunit 1
VDALKGAITEAKALKDVGAYRAAQDLLALTGTREPEARFDKDWADRTLKENAANTKRLEDELKGYKNNLIKESIRVCPTSNSSEIVALSTPTQMGNEDLGLHYQGIGELEKAYESFNRMKQDILMQKHVIDTSKRMISVSILQEKWVVVQGHVQKLNATPLGPEEERQLQPYLKFALGLAQLAEGKFYDAAGCFLAMEPGMGILYNDVGSANDVAVYGGLCALATMDRNGLQRRVLDNSKFRTYLELEPHIRRAVQQFVNGRYSACLSILENYHNDYLLDIYLQRHVSELYHLIRSKSIIQYFIPFSCVTLDSMDEAFGGPGRSVEQELTAMIRRDTLKARIDKHNRVSVYSTYYYLASAD